MAFVLTAPLAPLALRSGGGNDGCAPCYGMSGRPSQWPWPRSCTIPHEDRSWPGPGERHEMHYTATFRKRLAPKGGFCGTLWDICPCLLLMSLCRRWWISCRMSCSSWQRSCWWFPSRLSKCRRSCLTILHRDVGVGTRSWWNSWWKCRRSFPIPRYFSGLWSSTSTFQFLVVVEDQVLVFKVFPLDSVQQRRLLGNAFLSVSWNRSLTLVQVDVFMVHLLLTLQLVMKNAQMSLAEGFFRTFPQIKKNAKVAPHSGSELPPHSSSWTAAAQLEDSVEWARLRDKIAGKMYFWNRRANSRVW